LDELNQQFSRDFLMHWLQKTYVAIPVLIDSFLQIELKSPCNDSEQEVAISVKVWKRA